MMNSYFTSDTTIQMQAELALRPLLFFWSRKGMASMASGRVGKQATWVPPAVRRRTQRLQCIQQGRVRFIPLGFGFI